jgi:tetratricopeptide (TPR) repeat protein
MIYAVLVFAFAPCQQSAEQLALWNDPVFARRFIESYAAVSDVEPRLTKDETKRMEEVHALMAADRLADAAKLLEQSLVPGASAVFDFTLAGIRFQRDELALAAAGYRTAVEKFPRYQRAWRNLGMACARAGDHAAAVPALTRLLELGGGDAFVYGLLGYGHWTLGHHLASESAYRMANLLDPRSLQWQLGLAQSFFEQRRFADAAAACAALIATDPDHTEYWTLQAKAFIGLAQPQRAAENLELLDGMGKSTPDTLNLLGDIYVNDGLFHLAAARYARALEAADERGLARALRAAKDFAIRGAYAETAGLLDAVEARHATALQDADRVEILRLRARVAVAAGADDEQARVLEEIVALDPTDGESLILLGKHAARTGEFERGIFWFERAAQLADFEADAKTGHAQLLANQGRYAEAVPLLRRALELRPRPALRDYLDQVERFAKSRS